VDCTGFAGILLEKTLKVPYIKLDKMLFNDTAVVVATPSDTHSLNSQTKSTALKTWLGVGYSANQ